MLNLKKTAIALLAFGSSAVFAGTMGPVCAPGAVTVPCESTAWDFGAQALYLKPSYNGFTPGALGLERTGTGVAGSTTYYNTVKTPNNWDWGFKLEGSYHFRTGNDLNLNWYHLGNTDKNSSAFSGTYLTAFPASGTAFTPTAVASNLKTRWDAVNLEMGQLAHFGEWDTIRFHGGVQYSYINPSLNAAFTNATTATVATSSSLKYNGFGPRVGADFAYGWGNGVGVYANAATALLVGTQKFAETSVNVAAAAAATTVNSFNGSSTQIVPDLEAKLGLTYTYAMAQGDLSLDLGWMWVNYFNALAYQAQGAAEMTTTVGATSVSSTNFGVQGLLFGLKWVGNVV